MSKQISNNNRYTCSTGSKFVGCCVTNPCATGCAQGNIRQAAFNKTLYGTFPDASCDAASNFYTCTAGKSFWGCCKSVPCTTEPTCPPGDLVPAFLGRPEQASFYDPDKVSTSISVYISTSASTSAYQSSTAGPVSSNNGSKGMNSSAVIGGAVGGVGVLAIVIGILVFILCRRRKQKRAQEATPQMSNIPAPIAPEKGFSYTEHPDPKTRTFPLQLPLLILY
jgi:hypothetical protein